MGLPQRNLVKFARKSVSHWYQVADIAEQKESEALRRQSAAEQLQMATFRRNDTLAKERAQVHKMQIDAQKQMQIAEEKLKRTEAIEKELDKAKNKIRRLEKVSNARKEKTIDGVDKPD